MKHTRGIDVARAGHVAEALIELDDPTSVRVYLGALVARANAYREADETFAAESDGLDAVADAAAITEAHAVRLLALRKATRDHDAILAAIVAPLSRDINV